MLGIIGAGKVGRSLALLLHAAGYEVRAVFSRTHSHANELAVRINAVVVSTPGKVVEQSDLTLLAVPDDAIASVASRLDLDMRDKAVVHTSGAHSVDVLSPLAERGAMTGSLHPVFPFADVEMAVANLPGATFALEATDERLLSWLCAIVQSLDGYTLVVPPGGKAAYHAALVIASNYTVTLYAVAQKLLTGLGADRGVADNALNVLVRATVDNLIKQGVPDALTGPLVRGDEGTLAAHLEALGQRGAQLEELYIILARLSYPMLEERGVSTDSIERLFERGNSCAIDYT